MQRAESESVEDASYAPVSRLAPANSGRSLYSPEVVEAGLRFATPGPVRADCCLRAKQSSHPLLPWNPSTTPAIHASTVVRIAIVIKALSHPGQAAASRDSSARGIGVVRPRGWRRFLWSAVPVWRCLLAGLNPARCKHFYDDGAAAVVTPGFALKRDWCSDRRALRGYQRRGGLEIGENGGATRTLGPALLSSSDRHPPPLGRSPWGSAATQPAPHGSTATPIYVVTHNSAADGCRVPVHRS